MLYRLCSPIVSLAPWIWRVAHARAYARYPLSMKGNKEGMTEATIEKPIEQSWKKLEEMVFQGLGEASMSWSERPTGVFDGRNAIRIGTEIMQEIKAHILVCGGSTVDTIP